MFRRVSAALLLVAAPEAFAELAQENPLGKVVQLLEDLSAKVSKEGEVEAKAFAEYIEFCDDASKNSEFALEDAKKQKGQLESKIAEYASDISVADSKIGELAAAISTGETDLQNAATIRDKEAADFAAGEKELMEAIDTIGRAIGVMEKQMAKNPASFAQVADQSTAAALQAMSVVLDAAAFSSSDQKRLQALIQSQQESADDDSEPGAPAAANYKSHSTSILDVLEDMKEKAEGQLSDLRKAESNARHNFDMLHQSLEDQKAADTKDLDAQKASKAEAAEGKASAEGDLEVTAKTLANSGDELANTRATCMQVAADHEATVAARTEELKTIAQAKQILVETSSGAVSQSYSLFQLRSTIQSRADLARSEVIAMVKNLARTQHSAALAQLASRLSAVTRFGSANGEDVFGKVRGLISDMISKLEGEAQSEATEKAWCDEQMAKTEAKKSDLEDGIAKVTSKIDSAVAKSEGLKEDVKVLESELAALTKEQAEMDKIRFETHAAYTQAKSDLELGLTGVRRALGVLREYYQNSAALLQDSSSEQQPAIPEKHSKASGAGSSIIGLLEVVESDFAKNLAQEETQEDDAQSSYDKTTQENKIVKASKEQDVTYKTKESKSLDQSISELSSDRQTSSAELEAVLEYYARVKDRCIAKPESYEERSQRRTAEIEGLKAALRTLEEETALVQRGQRGGPHRNFRGAVLAAQ